MQTVAFSTCIQTPVQVVCAIISLDEAATRTAICEKTHFSRDLVIRILNDLKLLNIVNKKGRTKDSVFLLGDKITGLWRAAII